MPIKTLRIRKKRSGTRRFRLIRQIGSGNFLKSSDLINSLGNLIQWHDADDPRGIGISIIAGDTSINDGIMSYTPFPYSSVSLWSDKSKNKLHLLMNDYSTAVYFTKNLMNPDTLFGQAAPTAYPYPAFDFTQTGDPNNPQNPILTTTDKPNTSKTSTVFITGVLPDAINNYSSYLNGAFLWGHTTSDFNGNANGLHIGRYYDTTNSSTTNNLFIRFASDETMITTPTASLDSTNTTPTPFILSVTFDSTNQGTTEEAPADTLINIRQYVMGQNGVNTQTATIKTTGKTALNPIIVGSGYGPNQMSCSYISEIIYYDSVLPMVSINMVEGYLAWKWGFQSSSGGSLESEHPYSGGSPVMTPGASAAQASAAQASAAIANAPGISAAEASAAQASSAEASSAEASSAQASAAEAYAEQESAAIASAAMTPAGQIASAAQASVAQASAAGLALGAV